MSDAINICFYSFVNIIHLEILGQLLRHTLNCNVSHNQFGLRSYLVIASNLLKITSRYQDMSIVWEGSQYKRLQGEGVGTEN